jgi:hypothetical protein
MRAFFRPFVHVLKWPVRIGVFVIQLLHHMAAFFAWIWMFVNVIGALAQAGLQANKLWELRVIEDIWKEGMHYFSMAGGVQWQKILALALIPACILAWRNAYATFEQFHGWVHEHRHAVHGGPDVSRTP